jgi:S-formylglutathione hydrolase FrmB
MKQATRPGILLFLLLFGACASKPQQPEKITGEPWLEGRWVSPESGLEISYAITDLDTDSRDLVFFLHGASWDHRQWIRDDSFYGMYRSAFLSRGQKPPTVVSLTVGPFYFIADDIETPIQKKGNYDALLMEGFIPWMKKALGKTGNTYLFGFSMGGFNAASLSAKHPEAFNGVILISPMIIPLSPFDPDFNRRMTESSGIRNLAPNFKILLKGAYETPDRWNTHDPFYLIPAQPGVKRPYTIITSSNDDIPGFRVAARDLAMLYRDNGVPFILYYVEGDHSWPLAGVAFEAFAEYVVSDRITTAPIPEE